MRNHLADCALRQRSLSCHLATYRVYHTQPTIIVSTWTFGKSRNAMLNQLSSRHHSILSVCIDDVKAEQKQERQIEISGILACADLLPHPLIFAQHTKANLKSSSRREHLSSINFQCANWNVQNQPLSCLLMSSIQIGQWVVWKPMGWRVNWKQHFHALHHHSCVMVGMCGALLESLDRICWFTIRFRSINIVNSLCAFSSKDSVRASEMLTLFELKRQPFINNQSLVISLARYSPNTCHPNRTSLVKKKESKRESARVKSSKATIVTHAGEQPTRVE